MTVLLSTIATLSLLGILSAVILYFVAQKFKVEEDPRIDEVEKMLPCANCGGCGFAGCRNMTDIYFLGNSIYLEEKAFEPAAGTITINSDAALSIVSGGLMQVWNGGTLNIEAGANIAGFMKVAHAMMAQGIV